MIVCAQYSTAATLDGAYNTLLGALQMSNTELEGAWWKWIIWFLWPYWGYVVSAILMLAAVHRPWSYPVDQRALMTGIEKLIQCGISGGVEGSKYGN